MRILLVDTHSFFRIGSKLVLESAIQPSVILEAENAKDALEIIKQERLDLLVIDVAMPSKSSFELLRYLQKLSLKSFKILATSFYNSPELAHHLLESGCEGYLPKNATSNDLIDAVKSITTGGLSYPKEVEEKIIQLIQLKKIPPIRISLIEERIIRLLSTGMTSKQIANEIRYTLRTVETKRRRLQKKFFVKTSAELISLAYKMGILSLFNK